MARVRWTPAAATDLQAIHDYVGVKNKSPVAARKLVRGIYEKCKRYAEQPPLGMRMDEVCRGARAFRYKSYVVFYKAISRGIEVLRIVHGSRDFGRLFGGPNGRHSE
jgi:toxin ParE1/3/4